MYIYKNLEAYFDDCTNCGECCRTPGMFLPEQIDVLAEHLAVDRKALFDQYLIAEMYAPTKAHVPIFILSPVKVGRDGRRMPQRIFDRPYVEIRYNRCVFRDDKGCRIHPVKPFECDIMLCPKMTHDKPMYLGKAFYYRKWRQAQDIVFSMVPGLEAIHQELVARTEERNRAEEQRSDLINIDIATLLNGRPTVVPFCE